ncbi:DsbA family oxidoreductase [Cellulomonas sp. P22]|uniref:DsbA family oxidoreductase n=1 Tax=Cellulomonas sp. P22 TaxID=3373189 RepID=UPI003787D393
MTTITAVPQPPTSSARTLEVEVWSDIACPWCYIGRRRYAAALAGFAHRDAVGTVWRSYELSPDTPAGPGVPEIEALARHKGIAEDQVRQMFAQVSEVAAQDGLTLDLATTLAVNMFDAHRLVHVARSAGGDDLADRTVEILYAAHFTHGADLGDHDTLVRLAADAGCGASGLTDDDVRAALAGGDGGEAVRRDEEQARALGVRGVPFFVADRRLAVSGAQPVEVFTQLLERAWEAAAPVDLTPAGAADACTDDTCEL